MNLLNFTLLSIIYIIGIYADDITYSVAVLPSEYKGTSVGVVIDGSAQPVILNPLHEGFLWRGKGTRATSNYYYVILDGAGTIVQSENQFLTNATLSSNENLSFQRAAPATVATSTFNDIFGAKYTLGDDIIQGIPRVFDARPSYDKFSLLYQEGQVQSIRVVCNPQDYQTMITSGKDNRDLELFGCNMAFITPYEDFYYKNVTLALAGMGSRGFQKRPFKIELSEALDANGDNQEIYNRSKFKLRNLIFDCTYIKNKLAIDVATAMGMEITQASFARLYINNQPFGLYDLFDPFKKKFVKNNFHYGETDPKLGVMYKCITANGIRYFLENKPEILSAMYTVDIYPSGVDELTFDGTKDILDLINFINNEMDTASEEKIKQMINVDLLLKSIALEYFVEHRDGFLIGGNNFNIYRNYETGQFSIWAYDFDATFGKFQEYPNSATFDQFMVIPVSYFSSRPNEYFKYNPIAEKLLKREVFKSRFNEILGETALRAFNKEYLGKRIDYFKEFLKHHIYWDIDLVLPTLQFENIVDEVIFKTLDVVNTGYYGAGYTCSGDESGLVNFIDQRSQAALVYTQKTGSKAEINLDDMVGVPFTKFSKSDEKDSSTSSAAAMAHTSIFSQPIYLGLFIILTIFFHTF